MLAHSHGQAWNAAELARSMDATSATVNRYRALLAGTFMIRVLPPWFENLGKRLVKAPKVYIKDSGILHFLLGLEDADELPLHPRYGASWEGFALEQVLAEHGDREAYFYATQRGAELDPLLLRRGRRWGFEFKTPHAPRSPCTSRVTTSASNTFGWSIRALLSSPCRTASPRCRSLMLPGSPSTAEAAAGEGRS